MSPYYDRVYYVLPYGHSQTLYYTWLDALTHASKLPIHCADSQQNVSIDAYFQEDYLLPPEQRRMTRFKLSLNTLKTLIR